MQFRAIFSTGEGGYDYRQCYTTTATVLQCQHANQIAHLCGSVFCFPGLPMAVDIPTIELELWEWPNNVGYLPTIE